MHTKASSCKATRWLNLPTEISVDGLNNINVALIDIKEPHFELVSKRGGLYCTWLYVVIFK